MHTFEYFTEVRRTPMGKYQRLLCQKALKNDALRQLLVFLHITPPRLQQTHTTGLVISCEMSMLTNKADDTYLRGCSFIVQSLQQIRCKVFYPSDRLTEPDK